MKAKADREERARELQSFKDEIRGALKSTPKLEDSIYQSMVKQSSDDKEKHLDDNPSLVQSLWRAVSKMTYKQKGAKGSKDEESGKKRRRSPSTSSSSSSRKAKKRSKKESIKKSGGHYNKKSEKKRTSTGGKSSSSKQLPTKDSDSSSSSSVHDMKIPPKKTGNAKSSPKGAKGKKSKCGETKMAKQFAKNVEGLQQALWNLPDKLEIPEYEDTEAIDEFVKKLATSPSCTIAALKELAKVNGVSTAGKNKDERIRTLINFKIDKAEGDEDE